MKKWRKHLSVLLALCLILSSLGTLLSVSAQEPIEIPLAYSDFTAPSCADSLVLTGLSDSDPATYGSSDLRAILMDGSINLTSKAWTPNFGAAYTAKTIALPADKSFSTFFTFSLTGEIAEGFIFTMNAENNTLSPSRGALGASTRENTISIEFDTLDNSTGQHDPSDNHITYVLSSKGGFDYRQSLDLNGTAVSLRDQQMKYAWVDYDGSTDVLTVTLSNANDKAAGVAMTVEGAGVKDHLTGSDVYAGFIGAIWGHKVSQCIHSWYLDNKYSPIDTANNAYVTDNTNVAVTASMTGPDSAVAHVTLKNDEGQPIVGAGVDMTANGAAVDTTGLVSDAEGKLSVALQNVTAASEIYVTCNRSSAVTTVLSYFDFNGADGQLKLTGLSDSNPNPYGPYDLRAKNIFGELRLTPIHWTPNYGAAFYGKKIQLGGDRSFSTFFTFSISGQRSDGFAFVLNTETPSATSGHNNLGVQQVNNNISIEFDTYNNGGSTGDADDNHIGYTYGSKDNFTFQDTRHLDTIDLADGAMKYAWVDFNGATNTLDVTVSNSADRAAGETMSLNLPNFKQQLGGDMVYAGFTVSTYNQAVQNDFYSWYFNTEYAPVNAAEMLAAKVENDFNNDGAINAGDLIAMKQLIVGGVAFSGRGLPIADRNGDGTVNVLDLVLMKRALAGLD